MASNMTFIDSDSESFMNKEAAQQMSSVFAKFRLRECDASSTSAESSVDGDFAHDNHTTGSEDEVESLPSTKSDNITLDGASSQPCFSPPFSPRLPKTIASPCLSTISREPNSPCTSSKEPSSPCNISTSTNLEQTPSMKKWQLSAAAVLQDLHWRGAQEKSKQSRHAMSHNHDRHAQVYPAAPQTVRADEKTIVAPATFVPPPGLPHPPNLQLKSSFAYTVSSFRRNVLDILRDLKLHKNVGAAVRQLRMYNVPQDRQTAEFADMLTLAVEEERGPARRLSIAFIGGLTRVFDRECCVAGVCLFFTEIYPDLRSEIHNLKSITESEILPTLKSVMRVPEMKIISPVVRKAMR